MKCILLCAGYATRLFPLTENFPKALLEIEEQKPLLDYILDEVNTIEEIKEIIVITNNRYYNHFEEWKNSKNNLKPIKVLNDNTNSNDDRLGAIGDIKYTIDKENINEDLMIIAGDNLFDYKLKDVMKYYNEKKSPTVCSKKIDNIETLKGLAIATLDENDKIVELEEKPSMPKSNVGVFATYIYPKEILNEFDEYLNAGNKPDAPGYFVAYLYKKMPVYAYKFLGNCYDVGTHESLKEVRCKYRKGQ